MRSSAGQRQISDAVVLAVRGVAALDEPTALEVIEAMRVHLDYGYLSRIAQLEDKVRELETRLRLATSTASG